MNSSLCSRIALTYFMAVLISGAVATEFIVGDDAGWVLPISATISYQEWAANYNFLVNDTLVFKYNQSVDSVVGGVSREEYISCIPIASHRNVNSKDGITVYRLSTSGPLRFISGNYSNCKNGEKLLVDVYYGRLTHDSASTSRAPAGASVKNHSSVGRLSCCREDCCAEEDPLCC